MGITELKLRCRGCDLYSSGEIISLPFLDLEATDISWTVAPFSTKSQQQCHISSSTFISTSPSLTLTLCHLFH